MFTITLLSFCAIFSTGLSIKFNETLAKTRFFPLAIAAYTTYPAKCVENVFEKAEVTKTVTAECGNGTGEWKICYGYTGVSHADKAIFLAYRGTLSGIQLMYETKRVLRLVNAKIGGKAAEYFYTVFHNIDKAGLKDEVVRLLAKYPAYDIWLTGHSLGGALASIAAGELAINNKVPSSKLKLITYGAPRIGNAEYATKFDKLVPFAFRVVNMKDTVPHLPPLNLLGYKHHSTEVWYEKGMAKDGDFRVCTTPEDNTCSNKAKIGYNWRDHIQYYSQMIPAYGLTGCEGWREAIKKLLANIWKDG